MKATIVFDIDEHAIKVMAVAAGPKAAISLIDVIDIDGQTDEGISRQIASLVKLKRIRLSEYQVIVMLPRGMAIIRQLLLPSHDIKEIAPMVDLQAVNHIPYARQEVEIGFHIIEKQADGYSKVLAVIIPGEIAIRYWTIFQQAKIHVAAITIASEGLWRFMASKNLQPEKAFALLDIDEMRSEICLCDKHYWLTSRDINVGHQQMASEGNNSFIRQWELTLANASKEKMCEPPLQAYLITSHVPIVDLAQEINSASNVEVTEIDALDGLNIVKGVKWPTTLTAKGSSIAALVGMAFSKQLPSINLIPSKVVNQAIDAKRSKDTMVLGVLAVITTLTLVVALSIGFIKKTSVLSRLDGEYRLVKKQAASIKQEIDQLKQVEALLSKRFVFADMTDEVYKVLPKQTSLVNLTLTNGNMLSLQGFSSAAGNINELQSAMVSDSYFSNVNLDYVNKRVTQDGEVNYFKITAQVVSSSK